MLHSVFVIIAAVTASAVLGTGYEINEGSILLLLTCGIALVGLPHGGLDHHVGTSLFSGFLPDNNVLSRVGFYVAYLSVAAIVLIGWYLSPLVTIVLFFTLSAWHFGLEEEERIDHLKWIDHLGVTARGGMVIWCTCLFQPQQVASLLETITPPQESYAHSITWAVGIAAPVFAVFLMADLYRCYRHLAVTSFVLHVVRVGGFALMFAMCPVLLSFAVYFCLWHSIRGLIHLRQDFPGDGLQLIRSLLPMSLLSIVLFAGGVFFYQSQLSLSDAVIRTLFIGLSAVAVPHLALHIVADSLRSPSAKLVTTPEAISCHW